MARSEKDLEIEGRTISTQELLDETERVVSLAHRYMLELQREGLKANDLSKISHYKELLTKEQERLDAPPPKAESLTREQERVMYRAFQWRALLIYRVDRAFSDEAYARIKYRRLLHLFRSWKRMYEEITVLWELATLDAKRLSAAKVDTAFLERGEDLRCELLGYEPPDREAWREYEIKLANHRYGPPPKAPDIVMPELPEVNDTSKPLAVARGRLYRLISEVSATGKAAFSEFEGREPRGHEALRRRFVVRITPSEFVDETLLYFGAAPTSGEAADAEGERTTRRLKKRRRRETPAAEAPDAEGEATAADASTPVKKKKKREPSLADELPPMDDLLDEDILPPEPVIDSRPGGAPPPPPDPNAQPPARVAPVIRPSPTRGRKR